MWLRHEMSSHKTHQGASISGRLVRISPRHHQAGSLWEPDCREENADAFRLPCGIFISALALAFCGVLVTRMRRQEFLVIAVTTGLAFVNWLWVRNQAIGFVPET